MIAEYRKLLNMVWPIAESGNLAALRVYCDILNRIDEELKRMTLRRGRASMRFPCRCSKDGTETPDHDREQRDT